MDLKQNSIQKNEKDSCFAVGCEKFLKKTSLLKKKLIKMILF